MRIVEEKRAYMVALDMSQSQPRDKPILDQRTYDFIRALILLGEE